MGLSWYCSQISEIGLPSSRWRQTIRQNWYPAFALWAILFILLFVLVVRIDHFRPGGERLLLWEGISVWPAEALRLVALLLSVFFLFKARVDLDENEGRIIAQFFTEDVRERERAARPCWPCWKWSANVQGTSLEPACPCPAVRYA